MPPRNTPPAGRNPRRRSSPGMPGGWLFLLLILSVLAVVAFFDFGGHTNITYYEFERLIQAKNVKEVTFVGTERIVGEINNREELPEDLKKKMRGDKFTTDVVLAFKDNTDLKKDLEKNKIPYKQEREYFSWVGPLMILLVPTLIILAIFFLFILPRFRDPLGGSFLNNYIKSPARRYERNKLRVTFADVADMQNAKEELQEVVDFLRSPDKFQRLGAQVPKGVLLVGPPGTGKTLLARAVAGEAGVPFFSISGSEFIQMFVGVGASRVRDMFKTAKDNAPCLLFIDEIDAVGRMRGAGVGGGSDEREQTLNQILSEMDGFQPNEMVIVLAATNRPDVLDAALLRPGRFDRHVTIDRPTWQGRVAILKVHTRNKPLADDVNLETVARKMIGMTGADLRNLANEAALLATRENKSKIDRFDFERAADRVLIGPKREEVLTPEDKRRIAYHEAGHALVTWLEPDSDRPLKVSIIPRGQTLGVNISVPEEERFHHGLNYFKARLVTTMGGRAADRLIYNQPYAGAESDLKQATRLARYMVTHWGMSDRLGPMSFRIGEEHVFLGKEIQEPRDFSEGTAAIIDEEVQRLLREADQRAYELLEKNRVDLDRLADALLQREELQREEIDRLLNPNAPDLPPAPTDNGVASEPGQADQKYANVPSQHANDYPVSGERKVSDGSTPEDQAIRAYTDALKTDPGNIGALVNRGLAYFQKGDYARAVADYTDAIRLDPKLPIPYLNRSEALIHRGETDQAIADCEEAIRLNPRYAKAFDNRGVALARRGDYNRAIADHTEAIRLDPRHGNAFYNRGHAYFQHGDYSQAVKDFTHAIGLNPKDAPAFAARANAYAKLERDDKGLDDCNEALRLNPAFAPAYKTRGMIYAGRGDKDRAIRDFDQAIQFDPKDPDNFDFRAKLHEELGNHAQATSDERQAQELRP